MAELKQEFLIKTEQALRDAFPPVHDLAQRKCLPQLDQHARDFLARAPFLCIGTQSPDGTADVSPRGDPCGFVKVLDDHTLLIPDRPGNNRLVTLSNIIANPVVGLLFLVPGYDETMRINGRASISYDPDLLSQVSVQGRVPRVAIVVRVDEVFIHCAKAFRRSRLWDPATFQDRSEMPSLMKIMLDQTGNAPDDPDALAQLDQHLEERYRETMY